MKNSQLAQNLIIGFLSSSVAGCAVREAIQYPSGWSPTVERSQCADLSGTYVNEAADTTLWHSKKNPASARAFLTSILLDGSPGSYDERQMQTATINIDIASRVIRAYTAVNDSELSSKMLSNAWTCSLNGRLEATFRNTAEIEGKVGNEAVSHLTILSTHNRSVVVHRVLESGAMFPPGHSRTEDWMLFSRRQ